MSVTNITYSDLENKKNTQDDMENNEKKLKKPNIIKNFDPERRNLAISYTRKSRKYSFVLMIISFTISIGILISRVTILIKDWLINNVSNNSFIIIGIFFIVGFLIIDILELPISFYLHSKLSRKYGLSKLNNIQWFKRYIKGGLVSFIISFPLFEGFYFLLNTFPETWWIWATIILIIITVILANLAPIILFPIFYKFEPLEVNYPELAQELLQMTQNIGIKVTDAFVWKLGEMSTTGNAALLGLGNTRRIIISDTMLQNYTENEIKWILAHELGHHKRHDLWKGMILGTIATILIFYLTNIIFSPLATFLNYPSIIGDISSFPVLGLTFWMISEIIINVPSLWLSRRTEKLTDALATSIIPDFPTIKSLFIKMADQNLSDISPPIWEKLLFLSHPPILERIESAKKICG